MLISDLINVNCRFFEDEKNRHFFQITLILKRLRYGFLVMCLPFYVFVSKGKESFKRDFPELVYKKMLFTSLKKVQFF